MDLKSTLVFSLFVVLSITDITNALTGEQVTQLGMYCNGTNEDVEVVRQYRVPKTETGKCLMKCLTDYYRIFDEDGKYNVANTEASLIAAWPEKSKKHMPIIATHCQKSMDEEPKSLYKTCQMSYDVMKCINDKARELGWFSK